MPKWATIQPEKNLRELSFLFPMSDQTSFYASNPLAPIGHVLGHEGKGSLFSYLKQHNWAESLSAGTGVNYHGGSAFSINVGLTEEGLENQQAVVLAVFQAIKRLREEGVPKWVVKELESISKICFDCDKWRGSFYNIADQ